VLFANRALQTADRRQWQDPPFAVESLMVERLAPRAPGEVHALLALWDDLRRHPDIAFRNHAAWPHASILAAGQALRQLNGDPSAAFDLNQAAAAVSDPRAGRGWLARLQQEAAAARATAEAPATLGPRIDRLLALVASLIGPAPAHG
jgi:hypothetical protein